MVNQVPYLSSNRESWRLTLRDYCRCDCSIRMDESAEQLRTTRLPRGSEASECRKRRMPAPPGRLAPVALIQVPRGHHFGLDDPPMLIERRPKRRRGIRQVRRTAPGPP